MIIRFAGLSDCAAVRAIYAAYIDTPITFECTLPSESAFADRMAGIMRDYPYLVAEEADKIAAYAYAHRQMEREAYQWNAELSVYVAPAYTSQGIGRALYTALIGLLRLQGVRTVYGGVTVPNDKSERLHKSLGFQALGTYHRTGFKNGCWHDVTWFEKAIAAHDSDPVPYVPIREIPRDRLEAVLRLQA